MEDKVMKEKNYKISITQNKQGKWTVLFFKKVIFLKKSDALEKRVTLTDKKGIDQIIEENKENSIKVNLDSQSLQVKKKSSGRLVKFG